MYYKNKIKLGIKNEYSILCFRKIESVIRVYLYKVCIKQIKKALKIIIIKNNKTSYQYGKQSNLRLGSEEADKHLPSHNPILAGTHHQLYLLI